MFDYDLLQNDRVREILIVTGRRPTEIGLKTAGTEILGYMQFLDLSAREIVTMQPNSRLPEGGPYVPINILPKRYLDSVTQR